MLKAGVIKPPFPFPECWARIDHLQRSCGVQNWLVPDYKSIENVPADKRSKYVSCPENVAKCESEVCDPFEILGGESDDTSMQGYEDEMLELNPEWAQRFSKAIKRMKQKVHKSRQRANWKNRK